MDVKELLSILADIATIITAVCATSILFKINVTLNNSGNTTNQTAKGNNNRQNAR